MNPEHPRFAEWDAAYVLGALNPADRRAFEEHLAECAVCRDSVTDLAPVPGLLSRLSDARVAAIGRYETPDDDHSPHLGGPDPRVRADVVRRGTARRRRMPRRAWALAVAGALVIAAAVAVPVTLSVTAPPGSVHALADVAGVPIEASVRLTDVAWGTRIDLVCDYTGEVLDAPEGGWPYSLAVVDDSGATTTLSTWRAAPGSTTRLSAGTDLTVSDIGAVEIRTIDGGDVLMRYAP